jgi:pyruvate/2-oxoglutarate dehydrogenase complex dihydrolipoamide acyltransferase (E2) component
MSEFTWLFPNLEGRHDLPALGEEDHLQITAWLVEEGTLVNQGQPLLRVETEDVSLTLNSPVAGRVKQISAHSGQPVREGQVIALFEVEEEQDSVRPRP